MKSVANDLKDIKIGDKKIETQPANFLAIEITGIP